MKNQQQQQHRRPETGILLVLHGNKQTGELLLGRIGRLAKKLEKEFGLTAVAPDGPFPADLSEDFGGDKNHLRTWWKRDGDHYAGLDDSLESLRAFQQGKKVEGILGFSQGARLAHLLATLHRRLPGEWFPHLRFVVFASGYAAPTPPELLPYLPGGNAGGTEPPLLPSLHTWGSGDELVTPDESEALAALYPECRVYVHPGRHHVPTKGSELPVYVDFIREALLPPPPSSSSSPQPGAGGSGETAPPSSRSSPAQEIDENAIPDEETAAMQRDEIQALEAIYPGAIDLRSGRRTSDDDDDDDDDDEEVFDFPISYRITLNHMEMDHDGEAPASDTTNWPKHPLTVEITYPVNYPSDDLEAHAEHTTVPAFRLLHQNTVFEFPSSVSAQLVSVLQTTSRNERGMPCVLSCLYAGRDFLDQDRDWKESALPACAPESGAGSEPTDGSGEGSVAVGEEGSAHREHHPLIRASSTAEIRKGTLEGLEIAEGLLRESTRATKEGASGSNGNDAGGSRGGGYFGAYTIGLVGKPSAGKSTFFNAATAFSRQRGQHGEAASGGKPGENQNAAPGSSRGSGSDLGGASMAAHPFTTIDPNVGYCLVPAPPGSCPEDDHGGGELSEGCGSTHGRDPHGRRFLPVLLKDVAGLVPGAYEGRGRGNQFLNDLTDANVLIHVVDSSGSADASGNKIVVEGGDETGGSGDPQQHQQRTDPLDDLAWIRAELVEWVYSNLVAKWAVISRKGRSKLAGMFSGYGQKPEMVEAAFSALEGFLAERYQRDRALDKIHEWDECDVHRLVSLFLGVRFPMALCLNKYDLSSARGFVDKIQESLPVHGAHAGVPLSARKEMEFVREQMAVEKLSGGAPPPGAASGTPPLGVWECLASAVELREPILVFPVSDMATMAPMKALSKVATGDPSLPTSGMIRCIEASGGSAPSCWNSRDGQYAAPGPGEGKRGDAVQRLRDAVPMKPGSTVEDVFLALKRLGALSGEFVRAEASSGAPGERPKPVPKHEPMGRNNRVIKIMTNKRTQWQSSAPATKERSRYQGKK